VSWRTTKSTSKKLKKDEEQIKQLNNPEQIEKYAREKYYMKKTARIFTS
jgi:cell division protein FtsB